MTDKEGLILLNMVDNLSLFELKKLLNKLVSPKDIFGLTEAELKNISSSLIAESIIKQIQSREFKQELQLIKKQNINVITYLDPVYPDLLRQIYDPPIVLYIKGNVDLNGKNIAIVGSRRASYYGISTAERLARQLSSYGFTIVSGFARGIDTAAHRGAILGKNNTIAVFGCGIDKIYPPENEKFVEDVLKSGSIISEFPLGTPPYKQNFPRRNRIISGLSYGVVVIEANKYSGSLITARLAAEQGREVFSVPGRIDTVSSLGTNVLIKNGAKLVGGIEDILEEFDEFTVNEKVVIFEESKEKQVQIDSKKRKVYNWLNNDAKIVDELIDITGLNINEILSNLMDLELKGLVKRLPGNKYVRS